MSAIVRITTGHLKHILMVVLVCAGAMLLTACDAEDLPCTSDYDCEGEFVCVVSTGKCATYSCRECTADQECVENACVSTR